jgi:hypothetical protein
MGARGATMGGGRGSFSLMLWVHVVPPWEGLTLTDVMGGGPWVEGYGWREGSFSLMGLMSGELTYTARVDAMLLLSAFTTLPRAPYLTYQPNHTMLLPDSHYHINLYTPCYMLLLLYDVTMT